MNWYHDAADPTRQERGPDHLLGPIDPVPAEEGPPATRVLVALPREAAAKLMSMAPEELAGLGIVAPLRTFQELPAPDQEKWRQIAAAQAEDAAKENPTMDNGVDLMGLDDESGADRGGSPEPFIATLLVDGVRGRNMGHFFATVKVPEWGPVHDPGDDPDPQAFGWHGLTLVDLEILARGPDDPLYDEIWVDLTEYQPVYFVDQDGVILELEFEDGDLFLTPTEN